MNNPEDYVSYPLALALKKAGFDEPCRYYYNPKGMLRKAKDNALSPEVLNNRYLDEIADGVCSAVPLWQAQKWLRDVYKVDMNINLDDDTDKPYTAEIYKNKECVVGHWELGFFSSYESALSAGIATALELIEKKGE